MSKGFQLTYMYSRQLLAMSLRKMALFLLLITDLIKLSSTSVQNEGVLAGSQFVSFSSCSSNWLFTNDTATGVQATSVTGVSVSYGDLYINNAHGYHEGLYTCSNPNATTSVTVYAAPKFHGCSTTNCNLGTTVTVPEGQSTLLNISLDYVNGGPSGAKQSMQAVVLKRNGLSGSLLYCNTGSPNCSIKKPFIQNYTQTTTASNHTFLLRTSNVAISDSGVYVAKIELNGINNKNSITEITSSFTISVTQTSVVVSSNTISEEMSVTTTTEITTDSSLMPIASSSSPIFGPSQTSSITSVTSIQMYSTPSLTMSPSITLQPSPNSSPKPFDRNTVVIIVVTMTVAILSIFIVAFVFLLCLLQRRRAAGPYLQDKKEARPTATYGKEMERKENKDLEDGESASSLSPTFLYETIPAFVLTLTTPGNSKPIDV